ncbi:TonB family protein [Prosthecobacter sp. SYSU 5D2]|uniref:TonB family protein n=1 Tax=Prosthecobacter sp. SYSU 5D2 TaxID=3134134 RepID=UPI0031FEB0D2
MSQMALIGSPALSLPRQETSAVSARASTTWRFCPREDSLCGVAWLVAIAGSFLLIGLIGMLRFEVPMVITLSGAAGMGASEVASQDTTMAELQAMEEAPEVVSNEMETPEILEVPEIVEVTPEMLDLPELTEALITEDLFTVQAAPVIETVLKVVDPAKPKPKPQPTVAKAAPRRATSTVAAPGGTQGSGGGGGGNGAVGSGGKGKFPAPPYPSFARSRGIKGSVTLTIRVSPSGSVDSVSVSSGTGFSELDNYAASWVRNNWRFPTGTVRSFRLPIAFKLR